MLRSNQFFEPDARDLALHHRQGLNARDGGVVRDHDDRRAQFAVDFLNHIEWRELEKTLAEVFEKIGFKVTLTPSSKDGGKDVILETSFKGQKSVYFVEVKHWRSGKQVGTATMRDFVSVVLKEKVTSGIFVSSSGYVEGAYKALTVTERRKLVLQGREKVYTLCKTYALALSGLWHAPDHHVDILCQ